MMEMKYFRFLYGEAEQCALHLAEVQDTRTGETFTFLYLRKTGGRVAQRDSEYRLFLCPNQIDLAVVSGNDAKTRALLAKLLERTRIDTLVLREGCGSAEDFSGVENVVRLSSEPYLLRTAGWCVLAKPCGEEGIAVAHGPEAGLPEGTFSDCVMSVKALDDGAKCRRETSPDGYACALGCALRRDYDVCRYQGDGAALQLQMGTLLLSGDEDEDALAEFVQEARGQVGGIRFFGLAGKAGPDMAEGKDGFRRYFIMPEPELCADRASAICRGGWYQSLVVLKDGEGICCSGLLKYAEGL